MPAQRRLPWILLSAGVVAVGGLALASVWRADFILYNPTPSMPVGLYVRTSASIGKGAIVTVQAVDVAPGYAAERDFTGPGDRFLKRVAGAAGDVVCAVGVDVTLNGEQVAARQTHDSEGRMLPTWSGCMTLDEAQVLLLGETPDSFDGRYWGPTPVDLIEGVWRPIRLFGSS